MGKHPAPIFQHPIIRIINDSRLWSSFDPRAWYKQLWGFAESGAQQSSAYPPSHHPQHHKSQKNAGISTRHFYLVNTWIITSSTPKKSPVQQQQLRKMTGHDPNCRRGGLGFAVWIWGFSFPGFHGISRAGAEPGIPRPLLQNPHLERLQKWPNLGFPPHPGILLQCHPKKGPCAASGGAIQGQSGKRRDERFPEIRTMKFPV